MSMHTPYISIPYYFCHICFSVCLSVFPSNHSKVICRQQDSSPLSISTVFPQNKDILFHEHKTSLTSKEFVVIQKYCLIYLHIQILSIEPQLYFVAYSFPDPESNQ